MSYLLDGIGREVGVDIRRVGAGNESFRFVFSSVFSVLGALYSCEIFSVPMQECLFLFSARLGFENSWWEGWRGSDLRGCGIQMGYSI